MRSFDVDISGLQKLWLLEEDAGSYDRSRTVAGWVHVEFFGPSGVKDLADLAPVSFPRQPLTSQKVPYVEALTMAPGSRWIIPLDGLGLRPHARPRGPRRPLSADDIEGAVRFFIFGAEPDRERLVRVSGPPPVAAPPPLANVDEAGRRLYLQLFAREPNLQESRIVKNYFAGGKLSPAGLEDLLWSLLLHPEFQYLY